MMSRTSEDPHLRAHRPRSLAARALSSALCAALATTTLATSVPALASGLPLLRMAPEDAPASVLGLDSQDGKAANSLTNALRKAFANRGISGGEEISLEELRLTMGCENDGVACLSEGGKTLGVRRLVFGYLSPSGSGYQLDIQILDVEAGTLQAQASIELSKGQLKDKSIDETASAIVNELMPPEGADTDLPPGPEPLPEVEPDPEPDPEPKEPREGAVWFGLDKPTPTWKWAGFGAALALTVLAAGGTIGTGVWLTAPDTANYGFRQRLLAAASASESQLDMDSPNYNPDVDEFNIVRTSLPPSVDMCDYNSHIYSTDGLFTKGAELRTGEGKPGARDVGVGEACNLGDDVRNAQIGLGVATGVMGLTTLVFTGLLLIHKRNPKEQAFRRRGLSLGVAPRPEGGMSFGAGLRF